ncbi:TPA: helix-turn-helix transcriptional regulator [Streptococcus agalactiae]|uniref:LexA family transcriptional regulator n=3 Tax=Streptococcus agalactiae TaxID=1311 RepID=UPI0005E92E02|nr:helix-turn-helix transcriptional regulator [Streptococcus agalactiae]MCC9977692.1 helix-turn-helix transcriptional regulator [Streptococcus agalactiae]CND43497.1 Repressor protein [Streptococcus agalactiae]HEO0802258.1 helix-turn-helix transcriptional regulator [Streptococcus agalactiae]HEO2581444.1 helix-turn-helix transcriptional regulator [Streptococcus agalactiae]HEO3065084.1 helix-turn-helix transcriptional regulator [Streptococcus agalactiae]
MSGSLGNKKIMASNIRRHLEKKNMNPKEFSKVMNFKYSTVLDWVNAKTYPRIDKIELMANYFNVEKSDLVEVYSHDNISALSNIVIELDKGLKEPRHSDWISYGENLLSEQNTVEDSKNTVVELFSYNYYDHAASAGTGQYLNDVQVETIELPVDYDADFVIPVYGDSMEPEYHSGDYVFVKLSVELVDGDIGVFEYYGDAYIKQLLIHAEGAFLHSLNDKYSDIQIDRDSDFRIIGKVVGNFMPKEY